MFANNLERSGFPIAGVSENPSVFVQTAAQTIATDNLTALTFVNAGSTSDWEFVANELVCKTDGVYSIEFRSAWASNGTGLRYSYITNNAHSSIAQGFAMVPAAVAATVKLSTTSSAIMHVKAGEKLRLWVFQNSGGNLSNLSSVDDATYHSKVTISRI